MSCAQCSSGVSVSGSNATTVTGNGCGCGNILAPPRSSNPPTVPVVFNWLARVRNFLCGKLLVSNGDEIGALDSAISGPVLFDAQAQKVFVGDIVIDHVPDNFPCATDIHYGFPLYGLRPACRDVGENPDRAVAVVRPPVSDTGTLYGHKRTCSSSPGLKPEITPVEIVPADLPNDSPEGLMNLAFVDVPASGDCEPATRKWYAVPPQDATSVDVADIGELYALPAGPLDATDDTDFGLAVWVLNDSETKWVLRKVSNESLQALLGTGAVYTFVRPRPSIFSQYRTAGAAPTPDNQNIDLTTVANYSASATGVALTVSLYGRTGTANWDMFVQIDNEEFARVKFGVDNVPGAMTNSFVVPIPVSKQINVKLLTYIDSAGTYVESSAILLVDGFVR